VPGDGDPTASSNEHQANEKPMASSTAPDALPDKTLDFDVVSGRLSKLVAQVGKDWG
jgi:hypothetical protein